MTEEFCTCQSRALEGLPFGEYGTIVKMCERCKAEVLKAERDERENRCPWCGERRGDGSHYCTAKCGWCYQEKGYDHRCAEMRRSSREWEVYGGGHR